MGRLKKDIPKEILAERQRLYSKKYYWKNKSRIDERVKASYQKRKNREGLQDNES
jgi:hypothetical protein